MSKTTIAKSFSCESSILWHFLFFRFEKNKWFCDKMVKTDIELNSKIYYLLNATRSIKFSFLLIIQKCSLLDEFMNIESVILFIHNESEFYFIIFSLLFDSDFEGNFTPTLADWQDYNKVLFLFFILEIILWHYVATFTKSDTCMLFSNIFPLMSLRYQHNIWPIHFLWYRFFFIEKCQKYIFLFKRIAV